MDLAGPEIEIDIAQRLDPRIALAKSSQFQERMFPGGVRRGRV
jgi:hypothetical protein